jgi:hypothetical protein
MRRHPLVQVDLEFALFRTLYFRIEAAQDRAR